MIRISCGRERSRRRLLHESSFVNEINQMRKSGCEVTDLVVDCLDERGRVRWRAFCRSFDELEALARESTQGPQGLQKE